MTTSEELFLALAVLGFVLLFLVIPAALLRLAEKRWPRFSRFLDRHVGTEPTWDRPY